MADWPTIPAGAGYPLVDASTGEFLSTAVNGALSATIDAAVAAAPIGLLDRGEKVSGQLALKTGDLLVGVVGDSTGNLATGDDGTDEWVGLLLATIGAEDDGLLVTVQTVAQTSPYAYGSTVTISDPAVPSVGIDTFGRSGALEGSTGDGRPWSLGVANGAGNWVCDGSAAARSNVATTGEVVLDIGAHSSVALDLDWTMIHGGTPATTKDRRILLAYKDSSNYLYLRVATATNNGLSWSLNKRIGGTASSIATGSTSAISASSTPQTPVINTSFNFQTGAFAATLGSTTINATISGADLVALQGATKVGVYGSPTTEAETIDNFEWTVTGLASRTLHVYNASISGSRLEVQEPIVSTLFPEPLDLLLISSSHNYTTRTLDEYEEGLDSFLEAFRAHDPESGIAIMSQNPQTPPSPSDRIAKQLERCAWLKHYARTRRIGYIPVTEAFLAEADWGTLIAAVDGIHPTGGEEVGGVKTGSSVWRDAVRTYLETI